MKIVTDTGTTFAREMVPELRNPFGLLINMILPLLFLLLFGPLLSDIPGLGGSPWQWFLPGILVMLALSGTTGAGAGLLNEMASGSFERMLVTPLSRVAILIGRTMKEMVTLLAQAVLLIVVLLPSEFRLYPAGALVGLLILAVFGIGLGSLSFALAIAAKKNQTVFYGVQQLAFFPLLLSSGVLLPMEQAPSWVYAISRANPASYIVEAERTLFTGGFTDMSVLYGSLAAAGTAVAGLMLGGRLMRRATL
ncbi:ABC transporter permease [Actinomadura sp. KC345]|uniref:ABC transporter permease n=1 Tax=Actinomadura sp. KC345 TaxID=2530371 RepID=UPI0010497979|nr:ABC transporter permease [Actinomadura sp. KC345]TDC54730.1 ABC transporter permease [Actinomadura sp. KC345]